MRSLSEKDRGNLEVGLDAIRNIEVFTQRPIIFRICVNLGKGLLSLSCFEMVMGGWIWVVGGEM